MSLVPAAYYPPGGNAGPPMRNPLGGDNPTSGPEWRDALAHINLKGTPFGGALSKSHTQRRDAGTGFVSNRFVTQQIGVQRERFHPDDVYTEALAFVGKAYPSRITGYASYPTKGIYSRNGWLASEEGRRKFGRCRTAQPILDDMRQYGQIKVGLAEWQAQSSGEQSITLIIEGRMRMPELMRAQMSGQGATRKRGGTCNEGDYAWLLTIKYKVKDPMAAALLETAAEVRARVRAVGGSIIAEDDMETTTESFHGEGDVPNYAWKHMVCHHRRSQEATARVLLIPRRRNGSRLHLHGQLRLPWSCA